MDIGKVADHEGPAIQGKNIKHNGCADHRLDKIHGVINLETIVYLHEVWPKVREWEACKWFKAD